MFEFHSVSAATRAQLTAAGLDPTAVAALIVGALREDLLGGIDVTSSATIPSQHRSTAAIVSRADGVVAGLSVAAAVFDTVCGETACNG